MPRAFDQLLVTIVANTTNPNVLQGRLLDRSPFLAKGIIWAAGSAAGLQMTVSAGLTTICRAVDINAEDRIPIEPDDRVVSDFVCEPGAQLGLAVTNTTAGDLDVYIRIELEEQELV